MCLDIGVPKANILRMIDPGVKEYKAKLKEHQLKIKKHIKSGVQCIVWVHYAGHGAMNNESYAILNEDFDRF